MGVGPPAPRRAARGLHLDGGSESARTTQLYLAVFLTHRHSQDKRFLL